MKHARGGGATDNLDFLLDAMCNAFGGIIFIGLLLSLLGREAAQSDNGPPPPASDHRLNEDEHAAWEKEVARLEQQQAAHERDAATLRRAMGEGAELQEGAAEDFARYRAAMETSAREAKTLETLTRSTDALAQRLAEARKSALDAEMERTRLEKRHATTLALVRTREQSPPPPRQQSARMPSLRQGRQNPFWLQFRYGKMYCSFASTPSGNDLNHVDNRYKGNWDPLLVIIPRPEAGHLIGRADDPGAGAVRTADWLRKRDLFADCVVYPDSYEAFSNFRDYISSMGLRYNWRPYPSDTAFSLKRGEPDRSVQ